MSKYKKIREFLGLSQSEMGRLLGISRGGYAMIESGKRSISGDVEFRFNAISSMSKDINFLFNKLERIKKTPWWKKPFIKINIEISNKNCCGDNIIKDKK